jgi:hypothetical protein
MKSMVFTSPLTIKFLLQNQFVRALYLLLFFCFGFHAAGLAQTKKWDKAYGGTQYDDIEAIISTPDGGYLLGGSSKSDKGGDKSENSRGGTDYWILRIDGDGKKKWDKTFGGDKDDFLMALVATPDGGFLLGGFSRSGTTGDKTAAKINDCSYSCQDSDFWIVKVDGSGQKQWDKAYGDGTPDGGGFRLDVEEKITSMVATPDGGFLLGGTSTLRVSDIWVVKIDGLGNQQWNYHYNDYAFGYHGSLSDMVITPDGGYLLGGSVYSFTQADKEAGRGEFDYWIVRIDNRGKYLWGKSFGGNKIDELGALVATPDGGYLLGGNSYSDKGGDKSEARRGACPPGGSCPIDFWVVKTDSEGNKLWDKTLGGTSDDVILDLMVTRDGGYFIGGSSLSGSGFEKSEGHYGDSDYWVIMLDDKGRKLWDKTLGGSGEDYISSVIPTLDGGFVLAGSSDSGIDGDKSDVGLGGEDLWLVKITDPLGPVCTAAGNILWEQWRYSYGIRVVDIPLDSPPTRTRLLSLFESPSNLEEEYGARIRGYICAPQTGTYTFWIAGDNETQLWLSPDANPANKVKIAGHPTWTMPRSWFESPSQQSAPVALIAGQRYYIEALHKEGTLDDHMAVAWQLPDGTMEAPIPGSRLSPYEADADLTPLVNTGAKLQVYPNPFSTTTTLAFTSPEAGDALLEIRSLQGSLVQTVFQGTVRANTVAQYELAGSRLTNGVYLARLILNGKTSFQRLVVNKQ